MVEEGAWYAIGGCVQNKEKASTRTRVMTRGKVKTLLTSHSPRVHGPKGKREVDLSWHCSYPHRDGKQSVGRRPWRDCAGDARNGETQREETPGQEA